MVAPRWILRQTCRFGPPCLRAYHSPLPFTSMPALSISKCSGPLGPRYGILTASIFWRRFSVLKSGSVPPRPTRGAGSRRTRWSAGATREQNLDGQARPDGRGCRPAGDNAYLPAQHPGSSWSRTRSSASHGLQRSSGGRPVPGLVGRGVLVCSCIPAAALDLWDQSLTGLSQHSIASGIHNIGNALECQTSYKEAREEPPEPEPQYPCRVEDTGEGAVDCVIDDHQFRRRPGLRSKELKTTASDEAKHVYGSARDEVKQPTVEEPVTVTTSISPGRAIRLVSTSWSTAHPSR